MSQSSMEQYKEHIQIFTSESDSVPHALLLGTRNSCKTRLAYDLSENILSRNFRQKPRTIDRMYLWPVYRDGKHYILIDLPCIAEALPLNAVLEIKEAMTRKPLNTIFIVLEQEDHLNEFSLIERLVFYGLDLSHKIVVLCRSFLPVNEDTARTIRNAYNNLCARVIFYNEFQSLTAISNELYSCMINMNPEKLNIELNNYVSNTPNDNFEVAYNLGIQKKPFIRMMKQITENFNSLIQKILNDNKYKHIRAHNLNDALRTIIIEYGNRMEQFKNRIRYSFFDNPDRLKTLNFLIIDLERDIEAFNDEFATSVEKYMLPNSEDDEDSNNMVKCCPYCKAIWFKADGLGDDKICGEIPKRLDIYHKRFYPFKIQEEYGLYTLVENKKDNFLTYIKQKGEEKEKFHNVDSFDEKEGVLELRKRNSLDKLKPKIIEKNLGHTKMEYIGCGQSVIWRDCPNVKDDELLEFMKTDNIEQVKLMVKEFYFN